jgi:ribonuclease HI
VNVTNESTAKPRVDLFTDGACSGNPGPGGWAYILRHPTTSQEKEAYGSDADTTNNRMELQAVISGLVSLKRPCHVTIHTDSVYVGQGMTQWIHSWKRNGWKRKSRDGNNEVKNVDLWKQLDEQLHVHDIEYRSVRGHSGHPENERCDELAVIATQEQSNSS